MAGTVHPFRVILEVPALLGPLDFWDWQLVQVLVEARHLVSSHLQFVNVPPVGAFYRSLDYLATATETHRSIDLVPGIIASFSWNLDLFLSFLAPLYSSLAS